MTINRIPRKKSPMKIAFFSLLDLGRICIVKLSISYSGLVLTFIQRRRFPLQTISPWALLLNFHGGKKKCEKIVSKTIYFEQFKKSLGRDKCCFYKLETGSREKRGPGLMVTSTGDDTSWRVRSGPTVRAVTRWLSFTFLKYVVLTEFDKTGS